MTSVHETRTRNLQRLMRDEKLDGIILFDLANYFYYTGDLRKQPRVYIPSEGEPTLLAFAGDLEDAKRSSWVKDVKPYTAMHEMMVAIMGLMRSTGKERPAIGANFDFHLPAFLVERFKLANPQAVMKDASDILMKQRMVKDAAEIDNIAAAQRIAAMGMETARDVVRAGVAEFEVAAEIEYQIKRKGAEGLSFGSFVNSGARSYGIHGLATRKIIENGDPVLIDVSPIYKGYCGNLTRVLSVGKPSEGLRGVSAAYIEAREKAREALRVGAKMMELDNAFYQSLKAKGLGDYQVRGVSHGIGLAFEEKPFPTIFPEHMILEFEENMTVSIGHSLLYVPGKGAARFEDVYRVNKDGAVPVAPYETGLIEV
ncbi:MAG: hypothetical protein A3K67_06025 [Euryarchaeota archaeon RBG_16_62_10]|nr:MAG: hypothetical protein A3K67_06025 [Euryarchaeota archaeon RBG_16_62_10]